MEKRICVTRKFLSVIAKGAFLIFPIQMWIAVCSFSGEKRGWLWHEEAEG